MKELVSTVELFLIIDIFSLFAGDAPVYPKIINMSPFEKVYNWEPAKLLAHSQNHMPPAQQPALDS